MVGVATSGGGSAGSTSTAAGSSPAVGGSVSRGTNSSSSFGTRGANSTRPSSSRFQDFSFSGRGSRLLANSRIQLGDNPSVGVNQKDIALFSAPDIIKMVGFDSGPDPKSFTRFRDELLGRSSPNQKKTAQKFGLDRSRDLATTFSVQPHNTKKLARTQGPHKTSHDTSKGTARHPDLKTAHFVDRTNGLRDYRSSKINLSSTIQRKIDTQNILLPRAESEISHTQVLPVKEPRESVSLQTSISSKVSAAVSAAISTKLAPQTRVAPTSSRRATYSTTAIAVAAKELVGSEALSGANRSSTKLLKVIENEVEKQKNRKRNDLRQQPKRIRPLAMVSSAPSDRESELYTVQVVVEGSGSKLLPDIPKDKVESLVQNITSRLSETHDVLRTGITHTERSTN